MIAFIIHPIRTYLNSVFQKHGVTKGCRTLLHNSRAKYRIHVSEETKKLIHKHPLIIAGNHPFNIEPLLTAAAFTSRRSDFSTIINAYFMGICPSVDRHLIPVYIQHHKGHKRKGIFKLTSMIARRYKTLVPLHPEIEHQNNKKSIASAAKHISKGGAVAIYPQRGRNDTRWFSGIGHIVRQIKTPQPVYFVPVYIEGTSPWDFLRIIPYLGYLMPSLCVHISPPLKINDLSLRYREDGKTVTRHLEDWYHSSFPGWAKPSAD